MAADAYDLWEPIIPNDDGVMVNNLYLDELMPVVSSSSWRCLFWLMRRATGAPAYSVRASIYDMAARPGGTGCTRKTISEALRELVTLGILASDADQRGATSARVYRLCAPIEWDWGTIDRVNAAHQARVSHATMIRNDSHWRALRRQVFERDEYTCHYCGVVTDAPHCDHIKPVSQGGTNALENLVTACDVCNLSKHAKTPEEWLG